MRTIALEEHFAVPAFFDGPGRDAREHAGARFGEQLFKRLLDIGPGRIAAMDEAGIDLQVLSLTSPGVQNLPPNEAIDLARRVNEAAAESVRTYPARFAAFATIPTSAPEEAARELVHCVRDYGFCGALINGHTNGRYLDDPFFSPIFDALDHLDVPFYVHPTMPPDAIRQTYYSGFSHQVDYMLAGAGWGWHIETATHVLRMILGGLFDRYPGLQLIVGHLGEALPFMLPRLEMFTPEVTGLRKPVTHYLREQVSYTFSGFNFTPSFLTLLMQVGVDRIMFSTDWPYGDMQRARAFLEALPLSPADRERIAHVNAEMRLRLDAVQPVR